jgi:predicted short-subunit dehydrogenase-like oxidoreductase (DUF2520 family)
MKRYIVTLARRSYEVTTSKGIDHVNVIFKLHRGISQHTNQKLMYCVHTGCFSHYPIIDWFFI